MNSIQKSEAIKKGLRKGFQDGSAKIAHRKCYGYGVCSDGELVINPDEVKVVCWIFEQYLVGNSLGKIAAGLERQGIPSPTGRPKWNREAIDKLLSNEKYTGRVLLQKTVSTGAVQIIICQSQVLTPPENTAFSRLLGLTSLPFSLNFSLTRKIKGLPYFSPPLTTAHKASSR